jgi:hypothetical protein
LYRRFVRINVNASYPVSFIELEVIIAKMKKDKGFVLEPNLQVGPKTVKRQSGLDFRVIYNIISWPEAFVIARPHVRVLLLITSKNRCYDRNKTPGYENWSCFEHDCLSPYLSIG